MGVSGYPFKMTTSLMLRCAYWAQNQDSYEAAEEVIAQQMGIYINDDTIRQVTNYIGKLVYDNDCRKTSNIFEQYNKGTLEFPKSKDGIMYIEADGSAINTRHKNDANSSWRENKLGIVFTTDEIHSWTSQKTGEQCHTILRKDMVSYLGGVEEFAKQLFMCAYMAGYGKYKNTVIISDGAPWIANMAAEYFPDAQRILDLCHLKQNVYGYAKAKFKFNEELFKPWAEKICEMLENGQWKHVLDILNPEERYSDCVDLYRYINDNKDAIDYPTYKAKGYFVGSGAIESSHKNVVHQRTKQAGQRWEPITVQYLLTLRTKFASGRWEKDVVQYVTRLLSAK